MSGAPKPREIERTLRIWNVPVNHKAWALLDGDIRWLSVFHYTNLAGRRLYSNAGARSDPNLILQDCRAETQSRSGSCVYASVLESTEHFIRGSENVLDWDKKSFSDGHEIELERRYGESIPTSRLEWRV
jgi:hypothetical protein